MPAGSQVYGSTVRGEISEVGERDHFTMAVDQGQSITVVADPESSSALSMELFGPNGASLGRQTGIAGRDAVLQSIAAEEPGDYTITVSGVGGTTGAYDVNVFLNAVVEGESHQGTSNNARSAAEDLDASFLTLGNGSADRGAVLGTLSDTEDWYRFTLQDGQSASIGLGVSQPGTAALELYDRDANLLAMGIPTSNYERAIHNFIGTTVDGRPTAYFIRVNGGVGDYGIVVVRGGDLDTERNDPWAAAQPIDNVTTVSGYLFGPAPIASNIRSMRGQANATAATRVSGPIGSERTDDPPTATAGAMAAGISLATNLPPRIVVRFRDFVPASEIPRWASDHGVSVRSALPSIHGAVVALTVPNADVAQAIGAFAEDPRVLYAEPDYDVSILDTIPNDTFFSEAWGLHNTGQSGGAPDADIDAPAAWDYFTGSARAVIATLDTGVDYTHEDLAANMWVNPGEIPDDGIDNDHNGYVDDMYGIDTANNDSDPFDDNGHGTHVAGILGAVGNNGIGVTGVNWNAAIMPLKFISASGAGTVSDAIEAIAYMTMMKTDYNVNIVASNNSWGVEGFSQALHDAMQAANEAGILIIASAGNRGADNDAFPSYPASFDLDGILAVAATDGMDRKAGFSSYGATSVDLAAPGVDVLSTFPGNRYAVMSGTSMAAPYVTGAVALLRALVPNASIADVRSAILGGVDPVPELEGLTRSGGRLNLARALRRMGDPGDFYRIGVREGDVLVMETTTPAGGRGEFQNGVDPVIALIDPSGALLAVDDNGAADGRNARLSYTAQKSGNFTLQVASASGSGEYTVRLTGATGAREPFTVTETQPGDDDAVPQPPREYTIVFNDAILLTSLAAADLTIDGRPSTAAVALNGNTVRFELPDLEDGVHYVSMAEGAIFDVQHTPSDRYTAQFTVDRSGPRITVSSLQENDIIEPGAFTFTATFDEPLDMGVVDASDVRLIGAGGASYVPNRLAYDPPIMKLTVEFPTLPEDAYTLTLVSGPDAFTDLLGNALDGEMSTLTIPPAVSGDGQAGGDYVVHFDVDNRTTTAQPFVRMEPLGSGVFVSRPNIGRINIPDDRDDVSFLAGPGETISAIVAPDRHEATLRVSLVGTGTVYSAAPGEPVVFPATAIATAGTHWLRIDGDSVTPYRVTLFRNAALEAELGDSRPGSPLPIDGSLVPIGSGRYAVVGTSTPTTTNAAAVIFGVQPSTHSIVRVDAATGRIIDRFPTPDTLLADQTHIGLSIAEDGNTLLYVNSDADPTTVWRLDPVTGAVRSRETRSADPIDGLAFASYGREETIFAQDFEAGLGPNEAVAGAFGINDTHPLLNNGTRMMGHATDYGNDTYSYYQVSIDLPATAAKATLMFDYAAQVQDHLDGVNVQAAVGAIDSPFDLLSPMFGLAYDNQGRAHRPELGPITYDGDGELEFGTAVFDLSPLVGNVVTVRIQFGSDSAGTAAGINIDNLRASAEFSTAAVFMSHPGKDLHRQNAYASTESEGWGIGAPIGGLASDGGRRQFGFFSDGRIREYDPASDRKRARRVVTPPAQDIEGLAFDGKDLYASTASGQLFTFDPETGAVRYAVAVENGPLYGLAAAAVQRNSRGVTPPQAEPVTSYRRQELLRNGGFETGTLAGWTVSDAGGLGCQADWHLDAAGDTGCAPLAAPTEGRFAVYNSFAATRPTSFRMSQSFIVPRSITSATLSWRDTSTSRQFGGTRPREFRMDLADTDGKLVANAASLLFEPSGEGQFDWTVHTVDVTAILAAHVGETMMLVVSMVIPERFLGSSGFGADAFSLIVDPGGTVPDEDQYTLDLTGRAGRQIDIVVSGQGAHHLAGDLLELLDVDGETVLARSTGNPGRPPFESTDLAIPGFVVPRDGIYSLRLRTATEGEYALVVTDSMVFDVEPNDRPNDPLRRLTSGVGALGFLGNIARSSRLFAVDRNGGSIVELDPWNGHEVTRFPGPALPAGRVTGLAYDGTRLFAASDFDKLLLELDPDTGAVVDRNAFADLGISGTIDGLGMLGDLLIAMDHRGNRMLLIDPRRKLTVRSWFAPVPLSGGLAGAASRRSVFASDSRVGRIYELDAMTGALVHSFLAPRVLVVAGLAFANGRLYVGNPDGIVQAVDPDTGRILDTFATTASLLGLAGDDAGARFIREPVTRSHVDRHAPHEAVPPSPGTSGDVSPDVRARVVKPTFVLPTPRRLMFAVDFASKPSSDPPIAIVPKFLDNHAAALGLTVHDFENVVVTDQYVSGKSGVTHIYLRQTYQGIEVFGADINVNVAKDGTVISAGSTFLHDLHGPVEAQGPPVSRPVLSAAQALQALATSMAWQLDAKPRPSGLTVGTDPQRMLDAPAISLETIPAQLHYIPSGSGGVQLAWNLAVKTRDGQHWYDASIRASDGKVLRLADWVDSARYQVFASPMASPDDGERSIETMPHDPAASPWGWHDIDGLAGADFHDTRGNNVFVQEDRAGTGREDRFRPDGGESLNFQFDVDFEREPADYQSAAMTNLFYWVNLLHDLHYRYGFDEAAGNFQVNNYGRDGSANDPVHADAQWGADGDYANNAFFATPPDGSPPAMTMLVWDHTTPRRDSSFDSQVIIHEYGHGISNRLTGGPSNVNALDTFQSRGLGEGWSDWWAMMLTQQPTDRPNDARGFGTYLVGQSSTESGLRDFPYSFDMDVNPLTYGDIATAHDPHDVGAVWAAALWDMNWLLIGADEDAAVGHGFDENLATGVGGNNLALQLVIDGLKLQPANPSFLDARDAILLADQVLTGGENQPALWTAFARRGMGFSAFDAGYSDWPNVTEAFDMPAERRGAVTFDSEAYEIGDVARITVRDQDLAGQQSIMVDMDSSGGDHERVRLVEMPTALGVFRATAQLVQQPFVTGDGSMEVNYGDRLTVAYQDGDSGTGDVRTVTANADVIFVTEPSGDLYDIELEAGDVVGVRLTTPDVGKLHGVGSDLTARFVVLAPSGFPAYPNSNSSAASSMVLAVPPHGGGIYTIQLLATAGSGEYVLGVSPRLTGDMNLDGLVDMDDIKDFVLSLKSPDAYRGIHAWPGWFNGDMDGDGDQDFDDITRFADILRGGDSTASLTGPRRFG